MVAGGWPTGPQTVTRHCHGFNRDAWSGRICWRIRRPAASESGFRPTTAHASRAPMSQQKKQSPLWTSARRWLPQCNDWHFYCLEGAGRWWPGTRVAAGWLSVPHGFASSTERFNDQVQARVYLARRIYADAEPARQDADQGIRGVPDPRTASAVGLRRFVHPAG